MMLTYHFLKWMLGNAVPSVLIVPFPQENQLCQQNYCTVFVMMKGCFFDM